eukprot:Seg1246.3 transcript_id=Seg1246.3/GoldUCD/mRNA.D3Y31 product="hypothetical protein" protein_id=Seg1246.3/GoldUCD/D3Y31
MGEETEKTISYDKFLALETNKLSDFLAVRGLKTSGTRVELVARAFAAAELNMPIIATSEEQQQTLNVQYEKLLNDSGIIDPRAIPEDEKVDDITKWPPVTLGCIFSFILKVKDFDREYIGKYKDQKAYSYFDSGFVGAILINFPDIKPNHALIFCNVTASQSINVQKELWILINKQTVIFKSIKEPHDSTCMKTLCMSELAKNSKDGDKDQQVEHFLQGLVTTQQEIEQIEQLTRGQSGNKLWFRAREGRLTASKCHEIYTKEPCLQAMLVEHDNIDEMLSCNLRPRMAKFAIY